jgi:hypothetical protein
MASLIPTRLQLILFIFPDFEDNSLSHTAKIVQVEYKSKIFIFDFVEAQPILPERSEGTIQKFVAQPANKAMVIIA